MKQRLVLEISVEDAAAAAAAERAGAHRIELCADLSIGGITPGDELIRAVRAQVRLPIFSMIRPRGGDFVYSIAEFETMKDNIAAAKLLRMDGVVLGILNSDRHVDVERTQQLVELAHPLSVTFHRAFDQCRDMTHSLEDVIATGAARILTSGGAPSAFEGIGVLTDLVEAAQDRIVIVPGAGINPGNAAQIAKKTQAKEFHAGLSSSLPRPHANFEKFEGEVHKLAETLAGV